MDRQEEKKKRNWGFAVLFWLGAFSIGIEGAFLATFLKGKPFGAHTLPLAACVAVFAFTTAGFFTTEGKTEGLYALCSVVSAACAVVQLAIL